MVKALFVGGPWHGEWKELDRPDTPEVRYAKRTPVTEFEPSGDRFPSYEFDIGIYRRGSTLMLFHRPILVMVDTDAPRRDLDRWVMHAIAKPEAYEAWMQAVAVPE